MDQKPNIDTCEPIKSWVPFLERFADYFRINPISEEPGMFRITCGGFFKVDENDLLILARDLKDLVEVSASKRCS